MTPIEQVRRLHYIQQLALKIRSAREVVDQAPQRLEEIEARFRERNAEYVAVRDRVEELEQDQRQREAKVQELQEQQKKFKDNLMQVKNQREYTAVLREIDSVTSEISTNEENALKNMEELETLREELTKHEAHIQEERARVEQETSEVKQAEAESTRTIETLSGDRAELEQDLPAATLATTRTLEPSRQGVFLARIDNDGTCTACYVRVRPQVVQEIKRGTKLHTCDSCRRFLYHDKLLRDDNATDGSAQPGADAATQPAV